MKPLDPPRPDAEAGQPASVAPVVRAVLSIVPAKGGVSELHLDCGHVVRRRLQLCPPSRVMCPHC